MKIDSQYMQNYNYAGAIKDLKKQESNKLKEHQELVEQAAIAPDYAKNDVYSISKGYHEKILRAMQNGDFTNTFEELYNDILNNQPEDLKDELLTILNSAYDGATKFYSDVLTSGLIALTGFKYKVEIPPLGSANQVKDKSQETFKELRSLGKSLQEDIKNVLKNVKNYCFTNGGFKGINDDIINRGSNTFLFSDIKELSGGFLNELFEMKEKDCSSDKIMEKVEQSNLSASAKKAINNIVNYENK